MNNFSLVCYTVLFFTLNLFGEEKYELEVFVDDLDHPWSLVELSSGDLLLTELPGNLKLISSDGLTITEIGNVPDVLFRGQGGLSDIILHPDFDNNGWIYFSYSAYVDDKKELNTLFVDRAKIKDSKLVSIQNIFKAQAFRKAPAHFGAKLFFLKDGSLMITSGDGFDHREAAQSLDNHFGKVLRINDDGSIPLDNPFIKTPGALPEIWSFGIRNPQGIFQIKDGTIFENEHGPRGGDELNILSKGNNYGWPEITYGKNYTGTKITNYTHKDGMEQPVIHWTPSIAVCGMDFYDGKVFNNWKNNLLVTSLKFENLYRLEIRNKKVIKQELILSAGSRVRDVETGPDGFIYLAVEDPGRIIRLRPHKK